MRENMGKTYRERGQKPFFRSGNKLRNVIGTKCAPKKDNKKASIDLTAPMARNMLAKLREKSLLGGKNMGKQWKKENGAIRESRLTNNIVTCTLTGKTRSFLTP